MYANTYPRFSLPCCHKDRNRSARYLTSRELLFNILVVTRLYSQPLQTIQDQGLPTEIVSLSSTCTQRDVKGHPSSSMVMCCRHVEFSQAFFAFETRIIAKFSSYLNYSRCWVSTGPLSRGSSPESLRERQRLCLSVTVADVIIYKENYDF